MASSESGSGKIWIIVGAMFLIALLVMAFTAWLVLQRPHAGDTAGHPAEAAPSQPLFFKLEPFTVNLQGGLCGHQLLYVGITLELGNDHSRQFIRDHLPQIRSRLLLVLSGQEAPTLITSEGKRKLASAIGKVLHKPFDAAGRSLQIDDVLFTQFIVQ